MSTVPYTRNCVVDWTNRDVYGTTVRTATAAFVGIARSRSVPREVDAPHSR